MRIEDARHEVFRADLADRWTEVEMAQIMEDTREMQENSLGKLNEIMFEELEKIRSIDATDVDGLKMEIERSRAIDNLAGTIIQNANTVLAATRMRAEYTKASVSVPKMLEG